MQIALLCIQTFFKPHDLHFRFFLQLGHAPKGSRGLQLNSALTSSVIKGCFFLIHCHTYTSRYYRQVKCYQDFLPSFQSITIFSAILYISIYYVRTHKQPLKQPLNTRIHVCETDHGLDCLPSHVGVIRLNMYFFLACF